MAEIPYGADDHSWRDCRADRPYQRCPRGGRRERRPPCPAHRTLPPGDRGRRCAARVGRSHECFLLLYLATAEIYLVWHMGQMTRRRWYSGTSRGWTTRAHDRSLDQTPLGIQKLPRASRNGKKG